MPIHKLDTHQNDLPYFMLSREVVQSIDNPDALAIWCYLQSKPQNWVVLEDQIRYHFDIGRSKYLQAMKCLRELGLYKVIRIKDEQNRFVSNEFHIYPFPYLRDSEHTEMHTDIKEKEIPKEKEKVSPEEKELFEKFRVRYLGKKRGLDTEFTNFRKKHKDWKKVLPVLADLKLDHDVTERRFIPHLQTFINGRNWEMMLEDKDKKQSKPYGEEFNWRNV
jgi:hypothetical protein